MRSADPTGHSSVHHVFDEGNPLAERRTRLTVLVTVVWMIIEIVGGWYYNSMALLADGWHMGSHALALGLASLAYRAARHHVHNPRFTFGTWKIEVLAGFTSALILVGVSAMMIYESSARLVSPSPIHYGEALIVAVAGLLANLLCAGLLDTGHDDHPHHQDMNLRSAYLHVLADAATSVLAIAALLGGRYWGARWLDPAMGIGGGVLIAIWAWGLLRDTGSVLLDAEPDTHLGDEIRASLAGVTITDLHVWRVGRRKYACIISVAAAEAVPADDLKRRLAAHTELAHITVEVNPLLG
jgi:cation diffusion facilitator family transporter